MQVAHVSFPTSCPTCAKTRAVDASGELKKPDPSLKTDCLQEKNQIRITVPAGVTDRIPGPKY